MSSTKDPKSEQYDHEHVYICQDCGEIGTGLPTPQATKPVDELRNRLWYLLDSHAAANYNLIVSEDDSEEEEQAVTQKDRYRIEIEALLTEARIDELKWVKSRSAKHAGIWIDERNNELDDRIKQLEAQLKNKRSNK